MNTIAPIVAGSQIHTRKGRFSVQLEIPPESTLTKKDIDNILTYASWEKDPNLAEGREGGRSVLISREQPRAIRGLELRALQLSGIGYVPMTFEQGNVARTPKEAQLMPPSSDNFMKGLPGTIMTTTKIKDGKAYNSRPDYRARGTYTEAELKMKVEKTRIAAQLPLDNLVVSPLEAAGRYLDESLQDRKGKQFGFMVVPTPAIDKQRLTGEIYGAFLRKLGEKNPIQPEERLMMLYEISGLAISPLYKGLKDLHEQGRHVHLQPHLSNTYNLDNRIYMMDWSTLEELRGKPEDRLRGRILDMRRPVQDMLNIFAHALGASRGMLDRIDPLLTTLGLELYRGGTEEITPESLNKRAIEVGFKRVDDVDLVMQWMKDDGYEGFPKYTPRSTEVSLLNLNKWAI